MDETFSLEKALAVTDGSGNIVLQVCLQGTLYFSQAHSRARREGVARCFQRYQELVGDELCWAHPGRRGFERVNDSTHSPAQWLIEPGFDETPGWAFIWHGGERADSASHFSIKAYAPPAAQGASLGSLGYLSFCFPLTWFAERSPGFPSVLLGFCREVEPQQGYGGIGFERSSNRFLAVHYEPQEYALAMRFPGLEVDAPASHLTWLKDGIKGGNWLTVLGARWVRELGGLDALRKALLPPFQIHEFPEGVIIQAGPQPQLGDRDKGFESLHYHQLAQVLKPIRVKVHGGIHNPGPNRFNRKAFEAWLARFDS